MLFKFSPVMESNVRPVSVDNFLKAYRSIEIGAICNIDAILFNKFCYVYSPGHVRAHVCHGYETTRDFLPFSTCQPGKRSESNDKAFTWHTQSKGSNVGSGQQLL